MGNRKALQLCSQIERELNGILADSADETLRSLMVIGVRPAPSSMRVLVQVTPYPSAGKLSFEEIYASLESSQGRIRTEIASVIHRKRVPEILYQVVLA